jgi:hypothetical protein
LAVRETSFFISFAAVGVLRLNSELLLTDLEFTCDSFTLSRLALFLSMVLLLALRVFSTFLLLLLLSEVERLCAFEFAAIVTAARVIIVASSLNFIVFMTSFFKILKSFCYSLLAPVKKTISALTITKAMPKEK